MSNCNQCNDNPCSCNECKPARYSCGFDIQVDPYDASTWLVTMNGCLHRVKIPKISETCTHLSTDFSGANLIYNGECGQDIISGHQLGELINLNDLRDVDVEDADSCDIMVFDPGCTDCGDGCKPKPAMWRKYHIPDAGDCEVEPDSDGYYHVLIKDDCGCIRECRIPVVPNGSTVINYVRDSVPDDPDFPWYYGQYNDHINLYLAQNAPQYFGITGEIALSIMPDVFYDLDAPIMRLCSPDVPVPFSPALEKLIIPDENRIRDAIRKML